MGLETFNRKSRALLLQRLATETFDLVIIGGGITGASIFRDAAMRNMRVALVEARDFASATSGRSSKMIHGGLRYLRNLGFSLAWESCHERNLHIRLNKRLVRPIPFLMPLYHGKGDSRVRLRAGMLLYEVLSGFQNYRFHRFLSREETLLRAPGLAARELTGGCLYYDAIVTDNRWTIEIIKDGVRYGGIALNYAPVTGIRKQQSKVAGITVQEVWSAEQYLIHARSVINATGIFADHIRRMDNPAASASVRISKGTHLVFLEEDVPLNITVVFPSPIDGRPLFLVKREGCFLYGTTDQCEEAGEDPFSPAPGKSDVEYLLSSLEKFMPEAQLTGGKVQFVYSGFRPLFSGNAERQPGRISREDYIEISRSGLISVVGGKLTTARSMAIRVLDRVLELLGPSADWMNCRTATLSIGGTNEDVAEGLSHWTRQYPRLASYFRILFQRYGLDAHEICSEAMKIHRESSEEPLRAEVQYVCNREMVCTLEDLIDRRAGFLYWNAERRLERLRYGANVIRSELRISEEEFEQQYLAYEQQLHRLHTLPK